jgi:ketosteroid isomerase-like protein
MSSENAAFIRTYIAAYGRGGLDALAEFWHPDINWRAMEGALDDVGVMHGPDAMRAYHEQWEKTFDDMWGEVDEVIDAGDQAIAVVRVVGRTPIGITWPIIAVANVFLTDELRVSDPRKESRSFAPGFK